MATKKINPAFHFNNYVELSLRIIVLSVIALVIAMFLGAAGNDLHRTLVLSLWTVVLLTTISCFAIITYQQFKDKRTLWALIDVGLIFGYIYYFGDESSDWAIFCFVALVISCGYYYHKYKSNFKIKGGK